MSTNHNQDISLWRLAATTVARTLLAFTLPYFVAYYSVVGAWRSLHVLMLWLAGSG
jgi:hypothetical protein